MLSLLAISTICLVNGELVGPVTITENGEKVTRYAVSTYAKLASTDGSSIIIQHDGQVQIAANASDTYSPDMFQEYKLKGKTLSFTANISSISCSCNAALYFATIPGYGSNGKPNPGSKGDYYCDANGGNGEYCWELDTMEANQYALQVTPHSCSQNPGGYISTCDHGGCGTKSYYVDSKGIGPGTDYKINTLSPFRYSILFTGTSMNLTLSQGSSVWKYDICSNNQGYVESMNKALDYGMVLIMSYWGSSYSGMSWLDGMTGCTGDCQEVGAAIFSDIEIS